MWFNDRNYIKYDLSAYLACYDKKNDNQMSILQLNIREPLRVPYQGQQTAITTSSQCCGCCSSYGSTTISLSCDRNFITNGDQISVKTNIDNTQATKELEYVKLVLKMNKIMVSHRGRTTTRDS